MLWLFWLIMCSFSLVSPTTNNNVKGQLNTHIISPRTSMSTRKRRAIPSEVSCSQSPIQTNMTLKGGIEAGYFRKLAEHVAMHLCIELCCEERGCDVAFMSGKNCYGVQCFSVKLCQAIPAKTKVSESLMISHVTIKGQKAHSLQVLDSGSNQLVCKNSEVFYNTTLKGGYQAGNYTNFGKVGNMTECVRLCCGNRDCDVALMLENNCFAVACKDSNNCLPVHAKTSTSLAALNPRISYITSRSEEVAFRDQVTPNGICHAGIVSYDVTLRGGAKAGNFTPHGKVRNMETCITKCCHIDGCGAAMMLKDICFTVVCKDETSCEKKPTATSSNFNPKIAYVFRERGNGISVKDTDNLKPKENSVRSQHYNNLLAQRLNEITDSYTPTISIASTFSAFMFRSSKSYKQKHRTTLPSQISMKKFPGSIKVSDIKAQNNTSYHKASEKVKASLLDRHEINLSQFNTKPDLCFNLSESSNVSCLNTSKNNILPNKNSTILPMNLQTLTILSDDIDEPNCLTSDVQYNVTLRGGIKAGKFKDRGQMDNIKQCVRLCCLLTNCDLAFMLSKTCFSVECYSKVACEARHARSSIYSPTVCYVISRSINPLA